MSCTLLCICLCSLLAQDEEVSSITISTNRGMAPSMSEFFNNELLSDIDICSEEGQRFHCHKLVLINWSAPLRRMLTGGEAVPGMAWQQQQQQQQCLHLAASSLEVRQCQARPGSSSSSSTNSSVSKWPHAHWRSGGARHVLVAAAGIRNGRMLT
jgi:hypothetical protein